MTPLVRLKRGSSAVWVKPESVIGICRKEVTGFGMTTHIYLTRDDCYFTDLSPDEAAAVINDALADSPFKGTPE